jgi:glycosyltransferase involved in cell wall biosynthesis
VTHDPDSSIMMHREFEPAREMPRGLFISDVDPTYSGSGSGQRTVLLHEAFRAQSELHTLVFDDRLPAEQAEARTQFGPLHLSRRNYAWLPTRVQRLYRGARHCAPESSQRKLLRRCIRETEPTFLVIRYCYQAMRLEPLQFKGIPIILDIDDRPSLKAEQWSHDQYSHLLLRQLMKWRSKSLRRAEEKVLRKCAAVLVANHAEIDENAIYFPNIPFEPPAELPAWSNRDALVLIGNFRYTPNRNGLEWFLEKVWPRVLAAVPSALLLIAGAGSEAYARPESVQGLGFVDRLQDIYARACAAIVPVRFGGGSNIKLVEALSFGVPVIATERCATAFGPAVASLSLCSITDDEQTFAEACVRRLQEASHEPVRRAEAIESLQRSHSRQALSAIAGKVIDRVIQTPEPIRAP